MAEATGYTGETTVTSAPSMYTPIVMAVTTGYMGDITANAIPSIFATFMIANAKGYTGETTVTSAPSMYTPIVMAATTGYMGDITAKAMRHYSATAKANIGISAIAENIITATAFLCIDAVVKTQSKRVSFSIVQKIHKKCFKSFKIVQKIHSKKQSTIIKRVN